MVQCQDQEVGRQELRFSHVHFEEGAGEGERPYRRFRSRSSLGHPSVSDTMTVIRQLLTDVSLKWEHSSRRVDRHSPNLRNSHVPILRQVDPQPPRLALTAKPVEFSCPVGVQKPPAIPSNTRIPLAGGPHCTSNRARRKRRSSRDFGLLCWCL